MFCNAFLVCDRMLLVISVCRPSEFKHILVFFKIYISDKYSPIKPSSNPKVETLANTKSTGLQELEWSLEEDEAEQVSYVTHFYMLLILDIEA